MFMKVTPVVNFINVFHARIWYEIFPAKILNPKASFVDLVPKICTKNVHKKCWWNWHLEYLCSCFARLAEVDICRGAPTWSRRWGRTRWYPTTSSRRGRPGPWPWTQGWTTWKLRIASSILIRIVPKSYPIYQIWKILFDLMQRSSFLLLSCDTSWRSSLGNPLR